MRTILACRGLGRFGIYAMGRPNIGLTSGMKIQQRYSRTHAAQPRRRRASRRLSLIQDGIHDSLSPEGNTPDYSRRVSCVRPRRAVRLLAHDDGPTGSHLAES